MPINRVLDQVEIDDEVLKMRDDGSQTTWIRINNESGLFEIEKCQMVKPNKFDLELIDLPKRRFQTPHRVLSIDVDGIDDLNLTSIDSSCDKLQIGSFYGDLITFPKSKASGVVKIKADDETCHVKKNAHFMDVNKVSILPSNSVSMSLGGEGILKVWPIPNKDEDPVREIKGGINTFEIIGRGRNVITGCSDGSINLIELGSNELIWTGKRIKSLKDEVLSLGLMNFKVGNLKPHEKLFEVENKILFVGHKSGVISIWNLNNRLSIGEINTGGFSVNSIEIDDASGDILIGNSNGEVQKWKFNFADKSNELIWTTQVETKNEDSDEIEMNKMILCENNVIVLSNNTMVKLNFEDGSLIEQMIGFRFKLNDFCIEDKLIWCVGKYGEILGYTI